MNKKTYNDPKASSGQRLSSKDRNLATYAPSTKNEFILMAKVCHQSERFEDMLKYMKQVVAFEQELSIQGRNLLAAAYKNSISPIRTAWRVLEAIEEKEESRGGRRTHLLREAKKRVKGELEEICNDAIELITNNVLPVCSSAESKVYFLKMKGDYYRFIAECCGGDEQELLEVSQNALQAYEEASVIADELEINNAAKLSLALNFSVFCYEILNDPEQAWSIAKQAFDEYVEDPREESGDEESNLLAQLIRDNLALWSAEAEGEEEGNDEDQ